MFTEKKENNSHLSASRKAVLWKHFTVSKCSLHPLPSPAALGRGGRGQAGNKVKTKRKPGRKSAGLKNWWPGSVHSPLRLSTQLEAGCEGKPESKDVPAAPTACHLPGILTSASLDKQICGKYKENEVQDKMKDKGGQKNRTCWTY